MRRVAELSTSVDCPGTLRETCQLKVRGWTANIPLSSVSWNAVQVLGDRPRIPDIDCVVHDTATKRVWQSYQNVCVYTPSIKSFFALGNIWFISLATCQTNTVLLQWDTVLLEHAIFLPVMDHGADWNSELTVKCDEWWWMYVWSHVRKTSRRNVDEPLGQHFCNGSGRVFRWAFLFDAGQQDLSKIVLQKMIHRCRTLTRRSEAGTGLHLGVWNQNSLKITEGSTWEFLLGLACPKSWILSLSTSNNGILKFMTCSVRAS